MKEEIKEESGEKYHQHLRHLIDDYVHMVYRVSKDFPKNELYGVTSQWRRAALSIALNYIEGYARGRKAVHKNFLEISYGSLQESIYLTGFARKEGWIGEKVYQELTSLEREIGAMLWGILRRMNHVV